MKHYYFAVIILLVSLVYCNATPETSLWDHIIKKEQVVLTVEYQGRHLNVWRQDSHGYSRQLELVFDKEDAIPDVDYKWRSNQDQPNIIPFELFAKHESFCEKMVNDTKTNPDQFFRGTKLYLEFTIVAGQQSARNFNVTGEMVSKSSLFTTLRNDYADADGNVFLKSNDLKKLSREIFNRAAYNEEISSDYIASTQESQIIEELLGILKENKIDSSDLAKDEWNSVFWDDIFTRPDIQTEYANEVLKYDDVEKHFKLDAEKERDFRQKIEDKYTKQSSYGKKRGGGFKFKVFKMKAKDSKNLDKTINKEHSDDVESNQKDIIKLDDLEKETHKQHINIKWSGTKFTPKNVALFRLNTITMKSSSEVFFKRIITTKYQSTQKIEIKAEPKNYTHVTSVAGQMYLKDINAKIETLSAAVDQKVNSINQNMAQFTSTSNFNNAINNLQAQITEGTNQRNSINANHNGLRNEFNGLRDFTHQEFSKTNEWHTVAGKIWVEIDNINKGVSDLNKHADNILAHANNIQKEANHRVNDANYRINELEEKYKKIPWFGRHG